MRFSAGVFHHSDYANQKTLKRFWQWIYGLISSETKQLDRLIFCRFRDFCPPPSFLLPFLPPYISSLCGGTARLSNSFSMPANYKRTRNIFYDFWRNLEWLFQVPPHPFIERRVVYWFWAVIAGPFSQQMKTFAYNHCKPILLSCAIYLTFKYSHHSCADQHISIATDLELRNYIFCNDHKKKLIMRHRWQLIQAVNKYLFCKYNCDSKRRCKEQ